MVDESIKTYSNIDYNRYTDDVFEDDVKFEDEPFPTVLMSMFLDSVFATTRNGRQGKR